MALNPDLAEERLRPSFDVDAVSELLHGSAEDVQRWVELGELVASDPVFARVPFEDRLDRYQRALRRAQHMLDLSNDRGLGVEERKAVLELQDEFNPVALHWGMFVTSLFFQGHKESKVLDYQTQQHKVLTQIATSVSLTLCGHQMRAMYDRQQDAAEGGDFSLLAETHATSSGLKALTTTLAAEGIEACRLACGGHGYSDASGLPQLYADVVAQRTYEGENTLMFLQTARYLMRQPAPPAAAAATPPVDNWRDPDALLRLFEARAAHLRRTTTSRGGGGGSEVDSVRMASAHCMAVVVRDAFAGARERRAPAAVQRLVLLFALTMLERELGEFFEAGLLSPAQAAAARATARELLAEVRPDAVPLTDAWRFTDHFLNSALGRYDGNVYEALYAYAKKDPMNVMGAERSRL